MQALKELLNFYYAWKICNNSCEVSSKVHSKDFLATSKRQHEEEKARTSKISPSRARASILSFCLKQFCLFCGNDLNKDQEKNSTGYYKEYDLSTF